MATNELDMRPRQGGRLRVLGIARISTIHQDARSLEDQEGLYRAVLDQRAGVPYDLHVISGRGSGECLDRAEYLDAWEQVESGTYDLVIVDDLGRIARRAHVIQFLEHCEDHGTRVIAIIDHVDTALENWRVMAGFASMRHELYNQDTGKKIRRSQRHRFREGGVVQFVIYGYQKRPGAKTDADLEKDPAAGPVYDAIFTRLEDGASFWEVADWLNRQGVEPGPYARNDRWDGRMLARVVFNPIVNGVRVRNVRMAKRVNKTGKRKSVKAPASERLERHCPHLAHIDPARYDRVIAMLQRRTAKYARTNTGKPDARANVPKKRTLWPGQHATCGVCGRLLYWGGHGQADHMMCSGARDYKCWQVVSFDGKAAADRLGRAVLAAAEAQPGFDGAFVARVEAQAAEVLAGRRGEEERLKREAADARAAVDRLVDAIKKVGHSDALAAGLRGAEDRLREAEAGLVLLRGRPVTVPALPTVDELKEAARAAVGRLAAADTEAGRLLRRVVPHVVVYPFRALNSSRVVARALVTVDLAGLLDPAAAEAMGGLLRRTEWVDLFDPPVVVALRERVLALRQDGLSERETAARLGTDQTTVQRSMALSRLMAEGGAADPYGLLTEPPPADKKFRRHRNSRYRFEPLPGFPAWPARPAG